MFLGEHEHTLDSKGRLTIPAKFRHDLDDGLVVTRGLDGCLFIYTSQEWESYVNRVLHQLPLEKRNSRSYLRYIYSGAEKLAPDKQGRILLPARLREYAGLRDEVVVIGADQRLEVWAVDRWQATLADVEQGAEKIAEDLFLISHQPPDS